MNKGTKKGIKILLSLALFTTLTAFARAATVDELKQQINTTSSTIKQLEDEIKKYQTELSKTATEAKTLQGAVKTLDLNAKKLGTDLKLTEGKIGVTNLTIEELSIDIRDKQSKIENSQQALSNAIRTINQTDSNSLIETMLVYPDLSRFWSEVDTIGQFQSGVQDRLDELKSLRTDLLSNKLLTEKKKQDLMGLKTQLADQKTVVEINKEEKSKLLVQTKNAESGYKQIIADREARKKAFEQELFKIESDLKIAIDPKSIPAAKPGILSWPVASPKITQYFGNTAFAKANAAVYSGNGHNGIDLGAPIGTPILSASSGTVIGSGDTDTVCPGASYGKWIMVEHTNGLSTLYAHLSVIKTSTGQQVSSGDIIGYSGNTGYSTGPHLHFTVYASQGVKIMSKKSQACGGTYTMPIADLSAYLNPLIYL